MSTSDYVSIVAVIVAGLSVWYARSSGKDNRKMYIISETPVLIPDINTVMNNGVRISSTIQIKNTHESGIAKSVSVTIEKGKLQKNYSVENEFLAPNMRTKSIKINEDIDGCSFRISYLNIFSKKVFTVGSIHYIDDNAGSIIPDLQHMDFQIDGVTD